MYIICPKDDIITYFSIPGCRKSGQYIKASDNRNCRLFGPLELSDSTSDSLTISLAPLAEITKPITVNLVVFNVRPTLVSQIQR